MAIQLASTSVIAYRTMSSRPANGFRCCRTAVVNTNGRRQVRCMPYLIRVYAVAKYVMRVYSNSSVAMGLKAHERL